MIVLADSSPLITLARAQHFELLREFYGEIIVSREVHDEIAVAGADLVVMDDERARRAARGAGLNIAGSIAVLERGARLGRVEDLRAVFRNLLDQGVRYDSGLLDQSLGRLGLAGLGSQASRL